LNTKWLKINALYLYLKVYKPVICIVKLIVRLLLILFLFNTGDFIAQGDMYRQKKERKKLWRRWRSHRESYNPYLEKRARNKPSAKMAREERRELKRQKRKFRRDTRRAGKLTRKRSK
jgi:hypothetical protein